jgi:fructose-1,6-bisphosphatase/inositol monophosphatase family enzyme
MSAIAAVAVPIIKKAIVSGAASALSKQGKGKGGGEENAAAQEIFQAEQTKRAQRAKPPSDVEVRNRMQKSLALSAQNLRKAK